MEFTATPRSRPLPSAVARIIPWKRVWTCLPWALAPRRRISLSRWTGCTAMPMESAVSPLQPVFEDVFRYALFAHALAGPFTIINGVPAPTTVHPAGVSGIGDRPGGDFMITFGLWGSSIPENDMVGSTVAQAGTIMHELGHTLDLSH